MNDFIFFDEDDDYDETAWFEIKFPNQAVTRAYLFSIEYRYPEEYYDFLEDIEINGMIVAENYLINGYHIIDAMRSGMLRPALIESSTGDLHVYCQYWSPLEHVYKDFSDMSVSELEWLHIGLVTRVWSYN